MITPPSTNRLKKVNAFCQQSSPYLSGREQDELFLEAMRENVQWHREQNDFYQNLLSAKNYSVEELKTMDDLPNLPFIMANFFKLHELKSVPDEQISLHLTSSGTSGQKSQIFFDDWTIGVAQRMVEDIWREYGWISDEPCNYILFTYEPEEGSKLGTAYTDNFLCKFAPINKVTYALKYMGPAAGHKFDVFGVIKALQEYEEEGLPVRIFGFPAFFYFVLEQMSALKLGPMKLHQDSMTFFGGGWKGNQDKAISKEELYTKAVEILGLKNENCRDGFGSVEHCIPYIECKNHHFHIPTWSRVLIRDVKTLEPVNDGEIGYLNFISPYITSVPANNVLMGDLAIKHPSFKCGCGLKNPYFEIIGRAGISKNKSCAVAASELLKEFS